LETEKVIDSLLMESPGRLKSEPQKCRLVIEVKMKPRRRGG
jgi:hypothetical protein